MAYTPKRGPLAGQTFTGQMAYMNARAQYLGFSGYSEERTFRLNEAVRAHVLELFPTFPPDRLQNVMNKSQRIKSKVRNASYEDLREDDLGVESGIYYHESE